MLPTYGEGRQELRDPPKFGGDDNIVLLTSANEEENSS